LGAINALNLLDGVDGLATSVGIVLSISIAAIAVFTGHRTEAFLALAMAGALTGFLVYNRPPASIFLGDAGSMLIGLVLGMLAIRSSLKGPTIVALAAPTALWAIPILDVSMAILRRKLTGQSIYTTDRGHLHHLVHRRGFRGWHTVLVIGLLCLVTSVAAVISVYLHNEALAIGTVGIVFGTLVVTRIFGHHECRLLERRARQFVLSLSPAGRHRSHRNSQLQSRVQGSRQWEELWETLTHFAERFDLSSVQLNVTMPAISEEYHATWQRKEHPADSKLWRSEIPLLVGDAFVGRLSIAGACHGESACVWMGELIAGLKPFETHMLEILGDELAAGQHSDAPVDWAMSGAATSPNVPPGSTEVSEFEI
jgi:UDP-GlcNAc:undecaprenyl-phosphate GlcNAc-1-phosphate transferase